MWEVSPVAGASPVREERVWEFQVLLSLLELIENVDLVRVIASGPKRPRGDRSQTLAFASSTGCCRHQTARLPPSSSG